MKLLKLVLIATCFLTLNNLGAQQTKEVLLVGTMHQVGHLNKNAYKPMLKKAIAYQPQAIYVERQMKEDTVSVKNYFPKFYDKADSLSKHATIHESEIAHLRSKDLIELRCEEAKLLSDYYYQQKDYANFEYYRYLSRFSVASAGKLSNHTENTDLSIPLAIKMDIREIRSMDDQTYYNEYYEYWKSCERVSAIDGEEKYAKKAIRKAIFNDVIGFFTGLGKMVNSEKIAALYHNINSFEYRETPCESCDKGNYYWDYRNMKMAENIANQINANDEVRNIVVVGSGHIYGLIEAFERDHPEIKVKLYREL